MSNYRFTGETRQGNIVDVTVSADDWDRATTLAWVALPDGATMIAWEEVTEDTIERMEDEPLMAPVDLQGYAPTDDSWDDVHVVDARYRAGALYAYPVSGDARLMAEGR